MLERFVREICGCEARWGAGNIIADSIARVRAQVGQDRVLLGLSGDVDSSVVGALLQRAIGDQLTVALNLYLLHRLRAVESRSTPLRVELSGIASGATRVAPEIRGVASTTSKRHPWRLRPEPHLAQAPQLDSDSGRSIARREC
jgi:GMP synthase PP-ATPase subunit